jgi:hypothetical protein
MEFTVPQFIEKESKIVGPFSFKQLTFVGIAGAICIFLYFSTSFLIFFTVGPILLIIAFALAFLKINKTPLPIFIKNAFSFVFRPKIYLWKKKNIYQKFVVQKKVEEAEKEESPNLSLTKGGHLKQLYTSLEAKKKQ